MIILGATSPEAHRAAGMARELTTACMNDKDTRLAALKAVADDLVQGPAEMVGYTLAAFARLVSVITETYANALTENGQPITREELFAALAQQMAAAGTTI